MTDEAIVRNKMNRLGACFFAMLFAAEVSFSGSPEVLLRNTHLQHLPANTTTLVIIDLERCRASDLSREHRWLHVVTEGVARRLHFENLFSFDDVASMVYFEFEDGGKSERAWLIRGKPGSNPPKKVRDFEDGSFAIGTTNALKRLPSGGGPQALLELLSRVDPGAAIAGVSRNAIRLPFAEYESVKQVPLPGIGFALHLNFEEGMRLTGTVITANPATEAEGREFVSIIVDFLQPAGSLGPHGAEVAGQAEINAEGLEIHVSALIPRSALVSYAEMLKLWSLNQGGLRMTASRGGHAVAMLSDGTVAIAGGFDGQRGLTTIEVYDPIAQRFVPDSLQLTSRRIAPAFAFVPPDRLFLFYGMQGIYEGLDLPYGEVVNFYTHAVDRFKVPAGTGRVGASATLLQDGKILIAGGTMQRPGKESLPDAYLFDPQKLSFEALQNKMFQLRGDHAAALLGDGRVLFAGGVYLTGSTPDKRILTDTLEIYKPATRSFIPLEARLPTPRAGVASTRLPDGRVVIAGGFDYKTNLIEILAWDPLKHTISQIGAMQQPRYYFPAITLQNGQVLFTGGGMGSLVMRDDSEIWTPPPQ